MDLKSCRILVVGDSGVGKTSLVHRICKVDDDKEYQNTAWTTGCEVNVLKYVSSSSGEEVFLEFLDVGGHSKYKISRSVFYSELNGIIFVYDVSNRHSYQHIREFLQQIKRTHEKRGNVIANEMETQYYQPNTSRPSISISQLPQLIIGNKTDKVSSTSRRSNPAEDYKIDSMQTSAQNGSIDFNRLYLFFDRVIAASKAGVTPSRASTTQPSSVHHRHPQNTATSVNFFGSNLF